MSIEKVCSCKGVRTCLRCEGLPLKERKIYDELKNETYIYCQECAKAYRSIVADSQAPHSPLASGGAQGPDDITFTNPYPDLWSLFGKGLKSSNTHTDCGSSDQLTPVSAHPDHGTNPSIEVPGVMVFSDFVTAEEEHSLCEQIDSAAWADSQSGRRKQDFGPKVNFKKRRLRMGGFQGLPAYVQGVVDQFQVLPGLDGFRPVEMCNLEYCADRGAAIDPHFDDIWVWGERLVTLNLLAPTAYTLTQPGWPAVVVPLPPRTLVVLSGSARYDWQHAIQRQHVFGRRIGITFRELTPEFLEGGTSEAVGRELLDVAASYQGGEGVGA